MSKEKPNVVNQTRPILGLSWYNISKQYRRPVAPTSSKGRVTTLVAVRCILLQNMVFQKVQLAAKSSNRSGLVWGPFVLIYLSLISPTNWPPPTFSFDWRRIPGL